MQIRVFCRVRPGPASAVVCLPNGLSVRLEGQTEGIKDSSFAFDKVFGGQSSQAEVFGEVSDMVQSALDGYKVSSSAAIHQSNVAGLQGLGVTDQQRGRVLSCCSKVDCLSAYTSCVSSKGIKLRCTLALNPILL